MTQIINNKPLSKQHRRNFIGIAQNILIKTILVYNGKVILIIYLIIYNIQNWIFKNIWTKSILCCWIDLFELFSVSNASSCNCGKLHKRWLRRSNPQFKNGTMAQEKCSCKPLLSSPIDFSLLIVIGLENLHCFICMIIL